MVGWTRIQVGYQIRGWLVCDNYTETAQWTANTYTVSYDGNKEDSGWTGDGTATYDQNFTFADNGYTKKGYAFIGWSEDRNATTATYSPGQTITWKRADKLQLYAVWEKSTYEVSFDGNGASGSKKTEKSCLWKRCAASGKQLSTCRIHIYRME